ncbi:MAG TPA: cyclase family protein [Acetobacteraceae bacterium]|nr:cyclase family protein [Acetobacteraceae bacterium]
MAAGILAGLAEALASGAVEVIDLAQKLEPGTPVIRLPPEFGQSAPFRIEPISAYDGRGPAWAWNNIALGEHTGTHFDAPVHWITGKDLPHNALDTIEPRRFVAPANVIDCTAEAEKDPDFLLTPAAIEAWEARHGQIAAGSWVLLRSGWSRRADPQAFLNVDANGAHSPGPSVEAVKFLVEKRDVIGFGTECVGTDAGQAFRFDPPFPCHSFMHGANKFGLASLANLDKLPPTGAILITAPLKIAGGTGSPCRVLALVAKAAADLPARPI